MKNMKHMAIGTLLLLGISGASAQSLGDYAKAVRKNKAEPSATSRHYDNDNLPTNDSLSVVGPPPAGDASSSQTAGSAAEPNPAAAEHQKAANEWNDRIDKQKVKVDSLNHELDLAQRESRLHEVALAADAATRPGTAADWGKEREQNKSNIEEKQKALDAARQELDEMQEQAHKAGIAEKEKDSNQDKDQSKDKDQTQDKDQSKDKE